MKKTFLILSLIANTAFSQDICDAITAANKTEAEKQARANIAINIASQIDYSSKRVTKVKNDEGSRKSSIIESIQSTMKNANAIVFKPLAGNGGYSLSACISKENAAKPYINSQKSLMAKLQIAANKTKISTKEYEGDYEKVKAKYSEYAKQMGKGVYVENNRKELKSNVSFHIRKNGCVLAESTENSAMVLNMNYEECEKQNMENEQFSCKVCVEVSLQDSKTDKNLYEKIVQNRKVWTQSMEKACAKAIETVPNNIWEEIKEPIIKGECK
ncbi:MAG: hypothetical protein LBH25_01965 [Fibromonadaceae bacterium]|jgi:hypothetical protein|nr:hypothetical protein [Fibromonadaceae bacterium]